jgi:YgiT-type zinc finger domain-containing protein
MRKIERIGFWQGEKCEYCQGLIAERLVDVPRKIRGKYVLFKNVPVGVCRKCGMRYYAANVLKTISERARRRKPDKSISMGVYTL